MLKKQLDELERDLETDEARVRALTDPELLADLDHALRDEPLPTAPREPTETVSPHASPDFADVTDAELLRQLDEVRAEVAERRRRAAPPTPEPVEVMALLEPHPVRLPVVVPRPVMTEEEERERDREIRAREVAGEMVQAIADENARRDRWAAAAHASEAATDGPVTCGETATADLRCALGETT